MVKTNLCGYLFIKFMPILMGVGSSLTKVGLNFLKEYLLNDKRPYQNNRNRIKLNPCN